MKGLELYDKIRAVPQNACKRIEAGRLKGKTDINPMWRIKAMTEVFGPCGIGWKYTITEKRMETGANGEIAAFVDIDLFVKDGDGWSEAIPGTGGSMFVAKEKNGPYTSDECFKMALTDAISVSCKALGMGADVYLEMDKTTYGKKEAHKDRMEQLEEMLNGNGWELQEAAKWAERKYRKEMRELTDEEYRTLYDTFSAVQKG